MPMPMVTIAPNGTGKGKDFAGIVNGFCNTERFVQEDKTVLGPDGTNFGLTNGEEW